MIVGCYKNRKYSNTHIFVLVKPILKIVFENPALLSYYNAVKKNLNSFQIVQTFSLTLLSDLFFFFSSPRVGVKYEHIFFMFLVHIITILINFFRYYSHFQSECYNIHSRCWSPSRSNWPLWLCGSPELGTLQAAIRNSNIEQF